MESYRHIIKILLFYFIRAILSPTVILAPRFTKYMMKLIDFIPEPERYDIRMRASASHITLLNVNKKPYIGYSRFCTTVCSICLVGMVYSTIHEHIVRHKVI